MKNHAYARKRRQLQLLVKKLNRILQQDNLSKKKEAHQIIQKIRMHTANLKHILQGFQLKKILKPVVFALGLTIPGAAVAQPFAPPSSNPFSLEPTNIDEYNFPSMADIDNDGDIDLFISNTEGSIFYYENVGTPVLSEFAAPIPNPFGISFDTGDHASITTFVDLDNDGDLDFCFSNEDLAVYLTNIHYFENIGTPESPQFSDIQTNPFDIAAPSTPLLDVNFVDIDNDGDLDLLTSSYLYNIETTGFLYYQNTGTADNPSFAPPQQNPFGLNSNAEIYLFIEFADLDMDGDFDILANTVNYYSPSAFQYYKNIGTADTPLFGPPQENPFDLVFGSGPYTYHQFADLDADADLDILAQSYDNTTGDSHFLFYENMKIVSTKELQSNFALQLAPNPTHDLIHIQTDEILQSVVMLDLQGRILKNFEVNNPISLEDFPEGMYCLKIVNTDGKYIVKKIQKQ